VLVYLIRHRDRTITKQELFIHLWPSQFVSDAALARCITAIRKAVQDWGDPQRVIKTLHGRGYHCVALVKVSMRSDTLRLRTTPQRHRHVGHGTDVMYRNRHEAPLLQVFRELPSERRSP
jgi:DNA-binding winged helix-turn-helix (wHTH) protein